MYMCLLDDFVEDLGPIV